MVHTGIVVLQLIHLQLFLWSRKKFQQLKSRFLTFDELEQYMAYSSDGPAPANGAVDDTPI